MFLALLVGLVLTASPLLRGAWDTWAHTLVVAAVLGGTWAWLAFRTVAGDLPLPFPNRALAWIAGMAALATLSAKLSPTPGPAVREWWTWMVAFWILLSVPLIPEERRGWVERGILFSAWALSGLAMYQRLFEGRAAPEASLINPNVFAGTILMMLPLALHRGHRALAALLILCLAWTRSAGAWACLSLVLLAFFYRRGGPWLGLSLIAFGVTAVALHDKLVGPSAFERLAWWQAAWAMAWDRPWTGFGPGGFAQAFPAFRPEGGGLSSLYAHQFVLETAAGFGWPFAAAWLVWVLRRMGQSRGWAAWAMVGGGLHAMGDYSLQIPSNLWLFSYLLVAVQPERQAWFPVRARLKVPFLIALTGLTLAMGQRSIALWDAERFVAEARGKPDPAASERLLQEAAGLAPEDPAPLDELSSLRVRAYEFGGGRGFLLEAIGLKERSLELHPFRPAAWVELVRLYRLQGRTDLAEEAAGRARRVFRRRGRTPGVPA